MLQNFTDKLRVHREVFELYGIEDTLPLGGKFIILCDPVAVFFSSWYWPPEDQRMHLGLEDARLTFTTPVDNQTNSGTTWRG